MPSIFIWKAKTPVHTSSIIHYSGTNWFLEEHSNYSYSYQYDNQIMLSKEVIVYQAIKMPHNWVGSEILETVQIGYQLLRDDSNGTLEQIGEWMRYRSKHDSTFEINALESEFATIHIPSKPDYRKCNNKQENDICLIRFNGIS